MQKKCHFDARKKKIHTVASPRSEASLPRYATPPPPGKTGFATEYRKYTPNSSSRNRKETLTWFNAKKIYYYHFNPSNPKWNRDNYTINSSSPWTPRRMILTCLIAPNHTVFVFNTSILDSLQFCFCFQHNTSLFEHSVWFQLITFQNG